MQLWDLNMQPSIESAAIVAAEKLTIVGSAGTVLGWITSSEFGVLAGISIGVLGLLMNWYFKMRHDNRAETAHKAYMQKMQLVAKDSSPVEWQGVDD